MDDEKLKSEVENMCSFQWSSKDAPVLFNDLFVHVPHMQFIHQAPETFDSTTRKNDELKMYASSMRSFSRSRNLVSIVHMDMENTHHTRPDLKIRTQNYLEAC
jgi:hypothetical protein